MSEAKAPLLIIDDNPTNLYAFRQMLADMDVEVTTVDSGEQGLQILFDKIYALILLDVQMPGMSGFEVAKHIRKDRKNDMTPIVFITAYDQDLQKIKAAYEDGATDFIQKPIEVDIFRSKIQNYINLYKLSKSKEMLDSLLDLNTDGWWECNLSQGNKNMFLSPGLKELLGCKEYELADGTVSWEDIIDPEDLDKFNTAIHDHLHCQASYSLSLELKFKHKGGSTIWIICKGHGLKDESGKIYKIVGFLTDITRQKQIEFELAQSNNELEQFAYVASHDLQEPLRTITSYIEMLNQKFAPLVNEDPSAAKYMGYITKSAKKMSSLIQGLLHLSCIGKNHELEKVDLNEVLQNIFEDLQVIIEENAVEIKSDHLPMVRGNAMELYQLFLNLISNAIKFKAAERKPIIEIRAEQKDNGDCMFIVSDNGIGMESKYHNKVFEIFQRLRNAKDVAGTGIGLALCKKIIERHNGTIWVESEVDRGSTFYFTLQAILEDSSIEKQFATNRGQ